MATETDNNTAVDTGFNWSGLFDKVLDIAPDIIGASFGQETNSTQTVQPTSLNAANPASTGAASAAATGGLSTQTLLIAGVAALAGVVLLVVLTKR
jgi:hypothetical protein